MRVVLGAQGKEAFQMGPKTAREEAGPPTHACPWRSVTPKLPLEAQKPTAFKAVKKMLCVKVTSFRPNRVWSNCLFNMAVRELQART